MTEPLHVALLGTINRPLRRGARLLRPRRHQKPGTPPGTVVAPPQAAPPEVTIFGFDGNQCLEEKHVGLEALERIDADREHGTIWINVDGLAEATLIEKIGERFGLHPLALEDVMGTHQRAKVESYDDHLYVVLKMVSFRDGLEAEQVSIFLGPRYVISFQERPGDCLEIIRERLRKGKGRVRTAGADYLAYAIIDAIIDHYFPVLEGLGERLEHLESEILTDPSAETVAAIHEIRRELLGLRKAAWPLREAMATLYREENELISEATRPYLRDCYDHTIQLIDVVETYRELAAGLVDIYLSSLGQKNNEVMKVLTIIATIFIPLSFIAGLYGMNFNPASSPWNMPELNWAWGYPFALALMSCTAFGLLYFFFRKGWLGEVRRRRRRRRRPGRAGQPGPGSGTIEQ